MGEGGFDLILCGDGSADEYAQQVDVQLAARLGVPSVNAVTAIKAEGDSMVVERTLEDVVEEVEVPLPAVIAVTPDVATPRIPGMKDILAAGKKPMDDEGRSRSSRERRRGRLLCGSRGRRARLQCG